MYPIGGEVTLSSWCGQKGVSMLKETMLKENGLRTGVMVSYAPLLPLMVSAMVPSAPPPVGDCTQSPPPEEPVPLLQSWIARDLLHQLSNLFSPDSEQIPPSTGTHSGGEQLLGATTEPPAFCPL